MTLYRVRFSGESAFGETLAFARIFLALKDVVAPTENFFRARDAAVC
jgi:hypothetical protein